MMWKKILACMLMLAVGTALHAERLSCELSNGLLRLHILANSDSEYDQKVKLAVRDRILERAGAEFYQAKNRKAYRGVLLTEKKQLEQIANEVLEEYHCGYRAAASFDSVYFPRKSYDGIVLPEGKYEGLIVRLGAARGQNWWCVVYPPLCFTEEVTGEMSEEGKKQLRENLSAESFRLISGEVQYKLKIVELVQKIKKRL